MSAKATDYREPAMGEYDGHKQWNCQWPGCEFDTLDERAWREHIDPRTGAHREPLGKPGEVPQPLGAGQLAELDALRAEKEAREEAEAAAKAAEQTTTTSDDGKQAKKGG